MAGSSVKSQEWKVGNTHISTEMGRRFVDDLLLPSQELNPNRWIFLPLTIDGIY